MNNRKTLKNILGYLTKIPAWLKREAEPVEPIEPLVPQKPRPDIEPPKPVKPPKDEK